MTLTEIKTEIISWKFSKKRGINLSIGIAALLIYEFVARPYYRPYIYRSKINDFHLADTIGNSLGTIAAVFVLIGVIGRTKEQHYFLIKMITISFTLYELAHPLLGKPGDLWDVVATFLTGGLCFLLYNLVHNNKINTQHGLDL
jgi:hypothetical protein